MKVLAALGICAATILSGGAVKDNSAQAFSFVKESAGIKEYRMNSNDLVVLLKEDHSSPVVTFMVTYRVGSRNEAVGHTGSTHLLEHLMFKGSAEFNKDTGKNIWTVLQNLGAMINATTWLDRTNYFELLPNEHLEDAMKIEADRMREALLRDEDRQPEMTVVRNEFERGENDPFEALDKNIWATAYQAHPYHHSTIGWRSDIENVSTERLREFYNTFYWPNNATVSVIGDFEEQAALALVEKHFGRMGRSPHPIPEVYTTEPSQEGPRRIVIKRSGQTPIVGVAHKSPAGLDPDTYTLQVLSKILAGGKTGRLYRAIVDKGLASNLMVWDQPFRDNALFITYAFLTPGTPLEEVEKTILEEYQKIRQDGVAEAEVERAVAMIHAEIAYSRDGSYSVASALNEAIAVGDWTFYTTLRDKIGAVTPADVQRVAQRYLVEDQSTTGHFIPVGSGGEEAATGAKNVHQPVFWRSPESSPPLFEAEAGSRKAGRLAGNEQASEQRAPRALTSRAEDKEALNGLRVITVKTDVQDVVTIRGSFLGGDVYSPKSNSAVAEMTADMLDEGTVKRDKFAISQALEEVGATLSFWSENYRVGFNAKCLKKDVPLVIQLLAEQLREPRFDTEDLEKAKKRKIGDLERTKEETGARVTEAFLGLLYPANHPNYYVPIDRQIEDTRTATADDLREFHRKNYGLGNIILVAVGDVDRATLESEVRKAFQGWEKSPLTLQLRTASANPSERRDHVVTLNDKTSTDLLIGQPIGIDRNHKDYLPLMVGHYILGGNFSARLMETVRDKKGLTYGIRSSIGGAENLNDGYWSIWGTFAPKLLERGRDAALEQLELWVKKGVSAEELAAKKTTLTGMFKVQLATTGGLAGQILAVLERGWALSYIDDYPGLINALTLDQVNGAIRKYTDVGKLARVAAGSVTEEWKPLAQ